MYDEYIWQFTSMWCEQKMHKRTIKNIWIYIMTEPYSGVMGNAHCNEMPKNVSNARNIYIRF